MTKYVPVTPGGTICHWLEADTEAEAWVKLLKDAAHMPYRGIAGFQARGYTVVQLKAGTQTWRPKRRTGRTGK